MIAPEYFSKRDCTSSYFHGYSRSPEYRIWAKNKHNCMNEEAELYQLYQDEGIEFYEPWLEFKNFLKDMGERPSPKHRFVRIDKRGNFEPSNCRWATA